MAKQDTAKYVGVGIVVLIIIVALGFAGVFNGINFGNFLSAVPIPINTCSSISQIPGLSTLTNMTCANQQSGGVVTGISNVSWSNGTAIGRATIASYVLNGAGQQILGTYTTAQITKGINGSSPAVTQTVTITGVQNYQALKMIYTYTGQQLNEFYSQGVTFAYGVNFGLQTTTQCTQTNQTTGANGNPSYTIACSGYNGALDLNNYLNGYISSCSNNKGKTFLVSVSTIPGFGTGYTVNCKQAASTSLGAIYGAGSPYIAENVSIIYQNNSIDHTFYLTNAQPESSYNNQVIAQIYGYSNKGLNTFVGTVSPQVVINGAGTKTVVNPQGTLSYAQLEAFSPTCYQYAGVAPVSTQELNIYTPTTFNNCISNQTSLVNNFLAQKVQPSNPYYGLSVTGGSATGVPATGTVVVTQNPIYSPEIQVVAKAPIALTGVIAPVAQPTIVQPYPQPIYQSGSQTQITFNVHNSASIQGSAYIIVYQNGQQIGDSGNFNLPASTTTQETMTISGSNPTLSNAQYTLTATVYSAQQQSINSSIQFTEIIRPNCPQGSQYQNNTNCVSEGSPGTNKCSVGYVVNATGGCSTICQYNGGNLTTKTFPNGTTVTTCTYGSTPPPPPGFELTPLEWIIIIIIIILGAAYVLKSNKKTTRHTRRSRGGVE